MSVKTVEGMLNEAAGARIGIVAGRFNNFVVDALVDGALDQLRRSGVKDNDMTVVWVPGAWELPLIAQKMAKSGQYDAIIALGAVIQGGTPHFDYVAGECAKGLGVVQLESGMPVVFGVLTTNSIEQAIERAGMKMGNKGDEAARTAIELLSVMKAI